MLGKRYFGIAPRVTHDTKTERRKEKTKKKRTKDLLAEAPERRLGVDGPVYASIRTNEYAPAPDEKIVLTQANMLRIQ